ncbi:DUF1289 domain-containing protein [Pararhizobium mangrovi]|uniref:DUF1289 domain-containing protein n=1 Tax=Pararhizobium mangrovi TaxID=2590452 RepID=A0A506UCG4_9HYPH|nr:DUF1289 domain-containing protein [Pararhizobium mangrovi]TPW31288.1 DUF1289 domain-containing protein [Pararhizobium mangrovi]
MSAKSVSPEPAVKGTTAVESPCTGVCRIAAEDGLCSGCRRTIDEIAGWSTMTAGERHRIMLELPDRRATEVPFNAAGKEC